MSNLFGGINTNTGSLTIDTTGSNLLGTADTIPEALAILDDELFHISTNILSNNVHNDCLDVLAERVNNLSLSLPPGGGVLTDNNITMGTGIDVAGVVVTSTQKVLNERLATVVNNLVLTGDNQNSSQVLLSTNTGIFTTSNNVQDVLTSHENRVNTIEGSYISATDLSNSQAQQDINISNTYLPITTAATTYETIPVVSGINTRVTNLEGAGYVTAANVQNSVLSNYTTWLFQNPESNPADANLLSVDNTYTINGAVTIMEQKLNNDREDIDTLNFNVATLQTDVTNLVGTKSIGDLADCYKDAQFNLMIGTADTATSVSAPGSYNLYICPTQSASVSGSSNFILGSYNRQLAHTASTNNNIIIGNTSCEWLTGVSVYNTSIGTNNFANSGGVSVAVTSGNNNTLIGSNIWNTTTPTRSNVTAIGQNLRVNSNDSLLIGSGFTAPTTTTNLLGYDSGYDVNTAKIGPVSASTVKTFLNYIDSQIPLTTTYIPSTTNVKTAFDYIFNRPTYGKTLTVNKNAPNDVGTYEQYLTIQGAINAAVSGDVIIILPGVYDETLTVPAGIELRGYRNTIVRKTVTTSTVLVTVIGDGVTISNMKFELFSSNGTSNLTGILINGDFNQNFRMDKCRILLDNRNVLDTDTTRVVGVENLGTLPHFDEAEYHILDTTILVRSNGLGMKRGVLNSAGGDFHCDSTSVSVEIKPAGAGADYIGIENNGTGSEMQLTNSLAHGHNHDISATVAPILLGKSTVLYNAATNGKALTLIAGGANSWAFGDTGGLNNNQFFYRGVTNTTGTEITYRIPHKTIVYNLYVSSRTPGGATFTSTFTVRKNGVNTALTTNLTGTATSAKNDTVGVQFLPNDELSIQVTNVANAGGVADVSVLIDLY